MAATLTSGVARGMTICARMPRAAAWKATPCAWLPALAAMTPRLRSDLREGEQLVERASLFE